MIFQGFVSSKHAISKKMNFKIICLVISHHPLLIKLSFSTSTSERKKPRKRFMNTKLIPLKISHHEILVLFQHA